jgi:hypothetical protein
MKAASCTVFRVRRSGNDCGRSQSDGCNGRFRKSTYALRLAALLAYMRCIFTTLLSIGLLSRFLSKIVTLSATTYLVYVLLETCRAGFGERSCAPSKQVRYLGSGVPVYETYISYICRQDMTTGQAFCNHKEASGQSIQLERKDSLSSQVAHTASCLCRGRLR